MKIIYWSGTGNTERMAQLIGEGLQEARKEAEIITVDKFSGDIDKEEILILGCPAMGAEVLEECEFEPFIEGIKDKLSGKKLALFGSYGWGDGEWMRNWEEDMISCGANIILEPLIIQNMPEGESEEQCIEFGKRIADL